MHDLVERFRIAHLHFKCLPLADGVFLHSKFCQEAKDAS